jgi:hypothetical protein
LDVALYTNPKYNAWQMRQIRWGLENGVDVARFADPKFDWGQMWEIRENLQSEKTAAARAKPLAERLAHAKEAANERNAATAVNAKSRGEAR